MQSLSNQDFDLQAISQTVRDGGTDEAECVLQAFGVVVEMIADGQHCTQTRRTDTHTHAQAQTQILLLLYSNTHTHTHTHTHIVGPCMSSTHSWLLTHRHSETHDTRKLAR